MARELIHDVAETIEEKTEAPVTQQNPESPLVRKVKQTKKYPYLRKEFPIRERKTVKQYQ
jgi:hypothetical protein